MAAFSSKEPLLFAAAIEALTGAGDEGVEKDLGWKSSPLTGIGFMKVSCSETVETALGL